MKRLLLPILLALCGAVLGSRPARAQYPPPAPWPASFALYTFADGSVIADPGGDESPAYTDLSDIGGSTVYLASNGTHAFFRLRVRANPYDSQGNFASASWLVEIGVNGTSVAVVGLDGKPAGNNDYVYVIRPDGTGLVRLYSGGTLVPGPAARALPIGNGEYFIDFQVPIAAITAVAPGVTASTPVQLFYGSSATIQGVNKDYMTGAMVNFSGLATISFGAGTLSLSKASATLSGPNPPQVGVATGYDLTVTARNAGSNPINNITITDTLPAGVTLVSATSASGTISYTGQTVTWQPSLLNPGLYATATIRVSFTPAAAQAFQDFILNPGASGTAYDVLYPAVMSTANSNSITVGPIQAIRPDLLIRKDSDPDTLYAINDVYQATPSGAQIVSQATPTGSPAIYRVKVENDSSTLSGFAVLKAVESAAAGWSVVYKLGTTDITSAVLSATGCATGTLAPGGFVVVTVEMTPGPTVVGAATKNVTINAFLDSGDTTVRDSVQAVTSAVRPDLLIKKGAEPSIAFAIDGVYQAAPAGDQVETQTVDAGVTATYDVKLQNDGEVSRTYVLRAVESLQPGWTIVYKVGALDVSGLLRSLSGYTTASLPAHGSLIVTVEVTPGPLAVGESAVSTVLNAFFDTADTTVRDSVQATTTVNARHQPDLLIRQESDPDAAYAIDGEYQAAPTGGQVVSIPTSAGSAARYRAKLENDGNTTRTFRLRAVESAETGWTVVYRLGAADISGALRTGYTTDPLAPGASLVVTIEMTPDGTVAAGTSKSATIEALLDPLDTTVRDSVRAVAANTGGPRLTLAKGAEVQDGAGLPPVPARAVATTGDRIHYTLTFSNAGQAAAQSIVLVDLLPAGVSFRVGSPTQSIPPGLTVAVSYSQDGGATWGHMPAANAAGVDPLVNAVRWALTGTLTHLAPGNTASLSFDVMVRAGIATVTVLNTAKGDYQDLGGTPQPPASASAATTLSPPALSLQPNNSVASNPGAVVVLAHTVQNLGVAPDTIDITWLASRTWPTTLYRDVDGDGQLSPADVTLTDSDGSGQVDVGSVAAGAAVGILVRVAVPAGTPYSEIDTLSLIARSTRDPDRTASATDTIVLSNRPVLSISKYIQTPGNTTSTAVPGSVLTYGLICSNQGATQATGVVVMDTVPPFASYVPASTRIGGVVVLPDPYNPQSRLISVPVGSLAPGASVTITFQAVVN